MPGIIFAVILMLSFYTGTNFYVAKRVYQWLNFFLPAINVKLFVIVFVCIALSMFFGFLPIPSAIRRMLSWIGSYWIGVFVYLLLFFFLADLFILLGRLVKLVPSPVPGNIRFYTGLIVIIITICLVIYGRIHLGHINNVSYNIQTNKSALSGGMKIVLISDLHLGAVNSENNLSKIVHEVNKLEPDLVCIAGDIFNDDLNSLHNPSGVIDSFKNINSKYGVYACPGNHDGGRTGTVNEMIHFLEQGNVKLLTDEYTVIDNRLVLIGRLDSSPIGGFGGLKRKNITEIIASINRDLPVVVMDHNPANITQYGSEIELILSGHTHKGQIFPANLITNAIFTVDYGYYQKDNAAPQVIVTSGAGIWGMPMRIATNSEIVSIVLR